jgi:hypothetical protein
VLARVTITLSGSWGTPHRTGKFLDSPTPSLGVGDINEPATALDEAPATESGASIVPLGLREVTYDRDWVCGANGQQSGDLATSLSPKVGSSSSFTLPLVVLAGSAISSLSPRFTPGDNPAWAFIGTSIGSHVISASGPHAFVCGNGPPEISLFAAPPFNIRNAGSQSEVGCEAPPH